MQGRTRTLESCLNVQKSPSGKLNQGTRLRAVLRATTYESGLRRTKENVLIRAKSSEMRWPGPVLIPTPAFSEQA
jgi:hypothetical protein